MEFQVTIQKNNYGNLYFGHPFSKETYTNSCQLKTPSAVWEIELDGIYSGNKVELISGDPIVSDYETELRIIRGTKSCFIGDYVHVLEMQNDVSLYHKLVSKATVHINNPEYLDFETFTRQVLNDPLSNVENLKSITPEQAKKYMEYAVLYDKDERHSNKLINKAYFASTEFGVLILSEQFVDFNFEMKIDPERGVVGATCWISDNTSHYLANYKEI